MSTRSTLYKRLKFLFKALGWLLLILISYFSYNAISIYRYAKVYHDTPADVAVVLGAGTNNKQISPVFRERIHHGIKLYQKGIIQKIVLTGGFGKGQNIADSEIAKQYLLQKGIPATAILTETKSKTTIENLQYAKQLIDSLGYTSTLLISDPLHMKRAMLYAKLVHLDCHSSPTTTSMYRTKSTQLKSLIYETFYYSIGRIRYTFAAQELIVKNA